MVGVLLLDLDRFKLVNDGHALPHKSAETAALPAWAVWKGEAFGATFEPIVIAYNRQLIAAAEVPKTHAELTRFLEQREHRRAGGHAQRQGQPASSR